MTHVQTSCRYQDCLPLPDSMVEVSAGDLVMISEGSVYQVILVKAQTEPNLTAREKILGWWNLLELGSGNRYLSKPVVGVLSGRTLSPAPKKLFEGCANRFRLIPPGQNVVLTSRAGTEDGREPHG